MSQALPGDPSTTLLRVEFHCHTIYSKDSLTSPQKLLAACRRKGIHRVVITDHNSIQGALRAKELDPERVIIGEEIMTQEGELLAAYVQEEIPADLKAEAAIARLREQGAFISVSHPFDIFRAGHWGSQALERISPFIDAIEIFNARCMVVSHNDFARSFANQHNLPGTVGSDAHTPNEIGCATQLLQKFHDTASLKVALAKAQYLTQLSSPWVHFTSRYAVWYKKFAHQFGLRLPE